MRGAARRKRRTGSGLPGYMRNWQRWFARRLWSWNRSVAVGMAFGPAAGLAIADALVREGTLKEYHLLPSVRGDFLMKLERFAEAREEFERAAAMTKNAREKALMLERARECL